MSKNIDKKIDFSKFRISASSSELSITKKLIIHVPVCKPGKQRYVRVNPDNNYRMECAILKLEEDERPFLVSTHIVSSIARDIKIVILHCAIDRQGNIFLWPVPPVPEDGNENSWNQSQREIAIMAEKDWVRLSPNRHIASYDPIVAQGEIPEPTWPDLTLQNILQIAFGKTHIIDDTDHPALRKLWGKD